MLPGSFDKRFAAALAWMARNDAAGTIKPKQKYYLDFLCYRYRRQLIGRARFQVPTAAPNERDYAPQRRAKTQGELFGQSGVTAR